MIFHKELYVLLLVYMLMANLSADAEREVTNCVLDICTRYLAAGKVLVLDAGNDTLPSDESEQMLLKMLHSLTRWSISWIQSASLGQRVNPADGYILLTKGVEFAHQLTRVRRQATWNSRALFVVILRSTKTKGMADQKTLSTKVLSELWKYKAVNVIILAQTSDMASTDTTSKNVFGSLRKRKPMSAIGLVQNVSIDLYAWFPFLESGCGGAVQENHVILVDRWKNGRFLKGNSLFAPKVPNDLHGCSIFVSTFPWPPFIIDISSPGHKKIQYGGLEIDMIESIAQACNFTTVYMEPLPIGSRWGSKLSNGSWFGSVGDIINGRANVTIASIIATMERARDFDMSKYYITNAVTWVVPRARMIPQWQSLIMIFSLLIWILVATSWLVVALVFCVQQTFQDIQSSILLTLGILLGMSITPQPSKCFLVMIYAFYCLLINTSYQSSLISFLTEPSYYKQVTEESDLFASDMRLFSADGYYNQYFDDNIQVRKRLVDCATQELCLKLAMEQNAAIVSDKAFASFIISSTYIDNSGQPMFVFFPENIMTYYVGMMFAKGNILMERFNQIIVRTTEAGLMIKWRKDVKKLAQASGVLNKRVNVEVGPKRLALSHLQGAFIVLFIGNLFGGVVFFGEMAASRLASSCFKV